MYPIIARIVFGGKAMPDAFERLWDRMEARAKLGGRRLFETRKRAVEFSGPGGVKLSEAEKAELGNRACDDVSGQMFEETLRNRQAANKLEGTKDIPQDWWVWAKKVQEKRQAQGGGE